MPLRSVEAASREDAIAAAREQFGPHARVVGIRRVRSGGVLGFFATERYVAEVAPAHTESPASGAARPAGRRAPNVSADASDDAPADRYGSPLATASPARARTAAPARNGAAAWAAEAARSAAPAPAATPARAAALDEARMAEFAGLLAGDPEEPVTPSWPRAAGARSTARNAPPSGDATDRDLPRRDAPLRDVLTRAEPAPEPAQHEVFPRVSLSRATFPRASQEGAVRRSEPTPRATPQDDEAPAAPSPFTAALARMVAGDRDVRQAVEEALERPAVLRSRSDAAARPARPGADATAHASVTSPATRQEEETVGDQVIAPPSTSPELPVDVPTWAAEPEPPAASTTPREEAIAEVLRSALAQGHSDDALAGILRRVLDGASPQTALPEQDTAVPPETPTAETPTAETPTAQVPNAEAPKAEAPMAEVPIAEIPTADAPVAQPVVVEPVAAPVAELVPEPARAEPAVEERGTAPVAPPVAVVTEQVPAEPAAATAVLVEAVGAAEPAVVEPVAAPVAEFVPDPTPARTPVAVTAPVPSGQTTLWGTANSSATLWGASSPVAPAPAPSTPVARTDAPIWAEVVLQEPAHRAAPVEAPVVEAPVVEAPVVASAPVAATTTVAESLPEDVVATAQEVAAQEAAAAEEPAAQQQVDEGSAVDPAAADQLIDQAGDEAVAVTPVEEELAGGSLLARTASDPAPLSLDATTVMPPLSLLPPLPGRRGRGGRPPVPPSARSAAPASRPAVTTTQTADPTVETEPTVDAAAAAGRPWATVTRLPVGPLMAGPDFPEMPEPETPDEPQVTEATAAPVAEGRTVAEPSDEPTPAPVTATAAAEQVTEVTAEPVAALPPTAELVAEPVADAAPASAQSAAPVAPPAQPSPEDLVARLQSLGVPADFLGPAFTADVAACGTYAALTRALALRLPRIPDLPNGAGEVLLVIGPGVETLRAAQSLAASLRLDPDRVQWCSRGDLAGLAPKSSRVTTVEVAMERRQDASAAGTISIVAVDAPLRTDAYWMAQMLSVWSPVAVWAVVEATRKPEDLEPWIAGLARMDALIVQDTDLSADPAAVLRRVAAPVALVDGARATPHRWASLLCERLETAEA